ncbi:hypothetical protein OP10G_0995 [Fimbriimonas ginsengisoli Gsoil 348]|uniref:Winged helix DNA-binding domain-containing protein n=2 Tax=Fimbriimonas ginsengisoli TaxID=1005039 RepID=A0A068NLB2_FIMGI|nr:hypothetical protein OP10G_0995 [Fimbriimonas ginsengisoli Gsoil 348]
MAQTAISRRALNRALLARQMLLQRVEDPVEEVVGRLVAMQAQEPRPPFIGLWSRIAGFDRAEAIRLLHERRLVRASTLRGTLHLMTAADYAAFNATVQQGPEGARAILKDRMDGLDIPAVIARARELFAERPQTFTEIRTGLAKAFPNVQDDRAMGFTARMSLPLAAVPDDTPWGFRADPIFTNADTWLGKELNAQADIRGLLLRYLAAFGPATAGDFQAWSALKGGKEAMESLRPELVSLRDDRKRELFDLPDAPRPSEDVPAPVRYIADYDNLILSHVDRTRIVADEHRPRIVSKNLRVAATFLVDGFVAGTWQTTAKKKAATLTLSPFVDLGKRTLEELEDEGLRLLRFLEPGASEYSVQ